MKYLLLVEDDGQWYLATKDGELIVTENKKFWGNKEMPLIGYHPKTTIPVFDIDAELKAAYEAVSATEHKN